MFRVKLRVGDNRVFIYVHFHKWSVFLSVSDKLTVGLFTLYPWNVGKEVSYAWRFEKESYCNNVIGTYPIQHIHTLQWIQYNSVMSHWRQYIIIMTCVRWVWYVYSLEFHNTYSCKAVSFALFILHKTLINLAISWILCICSDIRSHIWWLR